LLLFGGVFLFEAALMMRFIQGLVLVGTIAAPAADFKPWRARRRNPLPPSLPCLDGSVRATAIGPALAA